MLGGIQGRPCYIAYPPLRDHFTDPQGKTDSGHPSPGSGSNLPIKDAWRHLPPGHPVDAIVYKEYRKVLTPARRMNYFESTDGRQVTISLVGKDNLVGANLLNAGIPPVPVRGAEN